MNEYNISVDGKTFKGLPKNTSGTFIIPEGVEIIAERAFAECMNITSVKLPSSLKAIREEAFDGCYGLISIVIPDGVESIGRRSFSDCYSLTEVTLPSSLKELSEKSFCDCLGLKRVELPEGMKTVPVQCFYHCSNLSEVVFPKTMEKIADGAFKWCKIHSVHIGSNVSSIGSYAFDSSDVESIYIGALVKEIGCSAFGGNDIKKIEVATENVVYSDEGCNVIMEKATGKVIQGSSVCTIPNVATSIATNAFLYQPAPKQLTIPSNVETIEYGAFFCCGETTIVLKNGVRTIQHGAFIPMSYGKITVFLPSSVVCLEEQYSSVEFHLDEDNKNFYYDPEGQNIITNNGTLVWGRLLKGIPRTNVEHVGVVLDSKIGNPELTVPDNVKSIKYYVFGKYSGITKVIIKGGTIIEDAPSEWKVPCEINVIIPMAKSVSGILKNTKYIIPAGTSKMEIEKFLGKDSIFL